MHTFDNLADMANEQAETLSLKRPSATNTTNLCFECEEEIEGARLAAIPGVERCIGCQEELEKTGQGRVKAL